MTVFCSFLSNILTANPEITSMKGSSIFINYHSFGINIICSLGKNSIDLFRKLKDDTHELIIPSSSNIFFISKT